MKSLKQNTDVFLAGGGEMGALTRAYNWKDSPLGCPANWPQGLKTAVRLLLSSGHPMLIMWGPELIQLYNNAYRKILDSMRHPRALGQRGPECWAEAWDIIGPQIEQVKSGGGATWNENHLVPFTRNGQCEELYWTYSYNPIDDPTSTNGVGGVLIITTETTAQVLAERRVKAAETRWRELFNQAPGFMCLLSGPNHVFEFANPRYFDLIGGRDIIGRALRHALPQFIDQGFGELLDQVYSTGKSHSGVATPITIQHSDGTSAQRYLDFVYHPVRDASGAVTGIFVDGYDVTERVLSAEILSQEARRKDEFLAMLAHELRNPLAPIRNASEILSRISAPESDAYALGDLITRQVTHLTHLVDDLLDVSRITQGRIELQLAPLDLDVAIRAAIESLQALFSTKQHEILYSKVDAPLYINGDVTRIVQCLANVLNNAAKYTDQGGRIQITMRQEENNAVIEVTDNGMGITPEVIPSLFELFVQADRTLDRSLGGLGIGLSIVHRLVLMHQGSVTAYSEGLGKGSKFSIFLPLIAPPQVHAVARDEIEISSIRILIVDDNIDAADSLARLLKLKGHKTEAVYNAHKALERVKIFLPDVVLLDIGLPDIDGYGVARQMREDGSANILIALTGYGTTEDIEQARAAGFNHHLTKPVSLTELERVLEELCGLNVS